MSQSLAQLLLAYLPLIIFIGVAAVIGLALLVVAFLVAYKQPDPEKLSAYECGFNAFDDARMKFDVRFYLVAILGRAPIALHVHAPAVETAAGEPVHDR